MNLTLEELMLGRPTMIKNKEYFSTEQYVMPFIDRMSKYTNEFIIQVKLPNQMSLSKDEDLYTKDVVYNRVYIQAVLPNEMQFNNHKQIVGLVYGLDVKKPIYKLFSGGINCACTNLCVFSPDMLSVNELEPETAMDFREVTRMAEQIDEVSSWLNRINDMEVPYNTLSINENLGQWVRNSLNKSYDSGYGKVKLATSTAIDAYKLLYEDEESPYYVKPGNTTNMFNIYNAWTELISNDSGKDIMNKCEKVLLLKNILGIN